MQERLTAATFIYWLLEGAHRVAQETTSEDQASPYLWGTAVEALDWLRQAPAEERERASEALRQCLETRGVSAGITIPSDPHEAKCLIKLLLLVHNPPKVL
jgi:hypothetical protein